VQGRELQDWTFFSAADKGHSSLARSKGTIDDVDQSVAQHLATQNALFG
jgi:hypothetical protein